MAILVAILVGRFAAPSLAQAPGLPNDEVPTQSAGDDDDEDRLGDDDDDDAAGDDDDDDTSVPEPAIAVFPWGDPDYTHGDELINPLWPGWVVRAYKDGGYWMTWEVSAAEPPGVGALYMVLDPALIPDETVSFAVQLFDFPGSSLFVDLLDASGDVVASGISGNIMDGTGETEVYQVIIDFEYYATATTIRLRRGIGEISVLTIWIASQEYEHGLEILDIRQLPAGPELTIGYPLWFPDRLEVYASADVKADVWQVAATNLPTDGLPELVWCDAGAGPAPIQFYRVGNGTIDSDLDSLPDARELVVHKTNRHLSDTDGDTLPDRWEVDLAPILNPIVHEGTNDYDGDGISNIQEYADQTDPSDDDTNSPVVTITFPTNNHRFVWTP